MTATQRQGHRHTNHPQELRLELSLSHTHTYTRAHRRTSDHVHGHMDRTTHKVKTTEAVATPYVSHTTPRFPGPRPPLTCRGLPHVPYPPSQGGSSLQYGGEPGRWLGPRGGPEARALGTRWRSRLWGRTGQPASEGRGARPSEPGPPSSLLPKPPCIRRDSPASGFEGGGATS